MDRYILNTDYDLILTTESLTEIIGVQKNLEKAELLAIEEINMHLSDKFDLSQEIRKCFTWNILDKYHAGDRVVYLGDLYEVIYTESKFSLEKTYSVGSLVINGFNKFQCIKESFYIDTTNTDYWLDLGEYFVLGDLPTNDTLYFQADTRNQVLIKMIIVLAIYELKRITPKKSQTWKEDEVDKIYSTLKKLQYGELTSTLPKRLKPNGLRLLVNERNTDFYY